MPLDDLQNRIARRVVHDLFEYMREFQVRTTQIEPHDLFISYEDFLPIRDRLVELGLVEMVGKSCRLAPNATPEEYDEARLSTLFPVEGDPLAPLPGERTSDGRPYKPAPTDSPPPMDWEDYSQRVQKLWSKLLERDPGRG